MQTATTHGAPAGPMKPAQCLSWGHVTFMTFVHCGALLAPWWFSWENLAVALVFYVATGLGVTVGYHRLLSHRAFSAPRPVTRVWAVLGALAMQGGPLRWVADHREHHFHSDDESDPHDIGRGLFFAHMGWLFFLYPRAFDDERIAEAARDVAADPFMGWLERNAWLPGIVAGLVLIAIGGPGLFIWAFCARVVALYHSTWLVNSAAHTWGYRSFEHATGRNNWFVALVTFGEGWHNNHHAWPSSARQGLRMWELDVSWFVICTLGRLRLASNIARVELTPEHQRGGVMTRR